MLYSIDSKYQKKVFLGFLFSSIDRLEYYYKFDNPIKIQDLFNIASLITLPSETEGRGLPIIEATACQVPIITRRYYPEEVYSAVIGENMPESDMLKVIEFKDKIDTQLIDDIIIHLFEDKDLNHNREVIQKRFNFELLEKDMIYALRKLYDNNSI
ncbi:MAG: glycosyltransferase [Candidatus Cloacimonetes bacterium]|nr:glycosyltransferase [Candidatus Cloacimonadota bacterium]